MPTALEGVFSPPNSSMVVSRRCNRAMRRRASSMPRSARSEVALDRRSADLKGATLVCSPSKFGVGADRWPYPRSAWGRAPVARTGANAERPDHGWPAARQRSGLGDACSRCWLARPRHHGATSPCSRKRDPGPSQSDGWCRSTFEVQWDRCRRMRVSGAGVSPISESCAHSSL